jgi:hypothetical protein
MRVLPLGLVLTTLAFVGCDSGRRDPNLAADTLTTTSSRIAASDVAAVPETAPVVHVAPAPVHRARTVRHTRSVSHSSTSHVYAAAPAVHRHTKRDALIGAGVGAGVGAITHGVKGGIVGGVLGGAAGAIIGHTVDK